MAIRNGGLTTQRNVPDVASVASPLTGVSVYSRLNGGWLIIGGTSVAAPIWAGFYSVVNAASEDLGFGMSGFANPAIYQIGSGLRLMFPDLHDVRNGNNGDSPDFGVPGFEASFAYDNATHWGILRRRQPDR